MQNELEGCLSPEKKLDQAFNTQNIQHSNNGVLTEDYLKILSPVNTSLNHPNCSSSYDDNQRVSVIFSNKKQLCKKETEDNNNAKISGYIVNKLTDKKDYELEDEKKIGDEEDVDDEQSSKGTGGITGRGVTLQMLLKERVLEPGEGKLTIDYLGQKFTGDLLQSGKIRSQETGQEFSSPSAWAISCKKIINPDKKSGCGWGSIKYNGKKLDAYKILWLKKKREKLIKQDSESPPARVDEIKLNAPLSHPVVHFETLGPRTADGNMHLLVEPISFAAIGKLQPFTVNVLGNVLLIIDLHAHLTTAECVGYLGGHWDVTRHQMSFPCKCELNDKEAATKVENNIYQTLNNTGLSLLGWYHTHPNFPPFPTLKDIDLQLDYQLRMTGGNDNAYLPSPYFNCLQSSFLMYWVLPPPDNRPNDYGRPMIIEFCPLPEPTFSSSIQDEMKQLCKFYHQQPNSVNMLKSYQPNLTYMQKLRTSLGTWFVSSEAKQQLLSFLDVILAT